MNYSKIFDVAATDSRLPAQERAKTSTRGDRRDGMVYLYTPDIELSLNVALATGRPLLVRGPSGSGKSSLAMNVARRMGWRYYEEVITSKTQHTDLEWRFDLLRRFRDAGANSLKDDADYVEPRALWWAFDRASALRRGLPAGSEPTAAPLDPSRLTGDRAVVLIDEIDKADPDVPNNLLVTLGSLQFTVSYLNNAPVEAAVAPLVIITSNDERELPPAFLRRCIVMALTPPLPDRLVTIAAEHFGDTTSLRKTYDKVAAELYPQADKVVPGSPSTAEYLDAVRTCIELKIQPKRGDTVWDSIVRATARKVGVSSDVVA